MKKTLLSIVTMAILTTSVSANANVMTSLQSGINNAQIQGIQSMNQSDQNVYFKPALTKEIMVELEVPQIVKFSKSNGDELNLIKLNLDSAMDSYKATENIRVESNGDSKVRIGLGKPFDLVSNNGSKIPSTPVVTIGDTMLNGAANVGLGGGTAMFPLTNSVLDTTLNIIVKGNGLKSAEVYTGTLNLVIETAA
ncbi:CS1 type fimbrial major subunit [Yersinia intermedia]|uniref:CS1 type fimbrial major subunit n=1 Tax=Yersinia intermedia TaxID=631 RepID=UPI0005DE3FC2|nr:CS1 type fimbrial major subunit [Yersinia intermedia]MCB5300123.1 CS1 type fimbrial major subunit [Yersinia intermedia]CNK14614.1 alpha-related fimbriae minor subunit 1 [Yersinia intermedia]